MKKILMIGLISLFGMAACDTGEVNLEPGDMSMEELFEEITFMANSVSCKDASKWLITPYGHKACGGPHGYMAYSTEIDTARFLHLIELHEQAERKYNKDNGVISDCAIARKPSGVICENDQPVLVY